MVVVVHRVQSLWFGIRLFRNGLAYVIGEQTETLQYLLSQHILHTVNPSQRCVGIVFCTFFAAKLSTEPVSEVEWMTWSGSTFQPVFYSAISLWGRIRIDGTVSVRLNKYVERCISVYLAIHITFMLIPWFDGARKGFKWFADVEVEWHGLGLRGRLDNIQLSRSVYGEQQQ